LQTVEFLLKNGRMERYQRGYVLEASNAFHVSCYVNEIVNGEPKRVQRSQRLCAPLWEGSPHRPQLKDREGCKATR
jgi:hypothetical protein